MGEEGHHDRAGQSCPSLPTWSMRPGQGSDGTTSFEPSQTPADACTKAIRVRQMSTVMIDEAMSPKTQKCTHSTVRATFAWPVKDTAPASPPEKLPRIFEPVFTTRTSANGRELGLGDRRIYGIVRQHRGWIPVESTPPFSRNAPSQFFPAAIVAETESPEGEATAPSPKWKFAGVQEEDHPGR